jgi:two-component system C4-dicarboxylate transport response regulator DctD
MAQFELQTLHHALVQHNGHIGETAEYLDIPRKNLYLRMKKYGLKREDYAPEGDVSD